MSQDGKMNLEDLIPQEVDITLYLGEVEKTFTLRKWSMGDDVWLKKTFDTDIIKFLMDGDIALMGYVIFRLLKNKEFFKPKMIKTYDDEGHDVEREQGGPEQVIHAFGNVKNAGLMGRKLLECYGRSMPDVKKETKPGKKSRQTGGKSLT